MPYRKEVKARQRISSLFVVFISLIASGLGAQEKKAWPPLPRIDALEADLRVTEPVAIGTRKQMFVDRYLVGTADEVLFTMMTPRRHPKNPILSPELPSEGQFVTPSAVLWNEKKKIFQLWYGVVHFEKGEEQQYPAYAESSDGLNWKRPVLNLVEFNGSKANNLIPNGGLVIRDDHDPDPSRRYKVVGCGGDARSVTLSFSPDGVTDWKGSPRNPLFTNTGDTHALFGWDERLQKYIGFFRPMGRRPHSPVRQQQRHVAVSFSDDADSWSPMVPVLVPDDHDPPGTEFYRLAAIRYEDLFIGLLQVLHMDAGLLDFHQPDPVGVEQTVDTQLVVSRDAVNWARVGNRAPWLAVGPYQSWDDMVVWTTSPLLVGDEIWVYYGGFPFRHQLADLYSSVEKQYGRTRQGSIGLCTLRRDGWVAVRPNGRRVGRLVTRSLTFEGSALKVNAQASGGKILVEALDAEGQPLPAFSGDNGITLIGDSLRHPVKWRKPLTELQKKPIRLRFTLEGPVELYAFQFVEE